MGLTTWQNSPEGRITRQDVIIAKNYLKEIEYINYFDCLQGQKSLFHGNQFSNIRVKIHLL
jgi:hypothetical protein